MREIPVVQLGVGGVGRALIEQVIAAESTGLPARRWRAHPRWVAVADSRGLLFRPEGLTPSELRNVLDVKGQVPDRSQDHGLYGLDRFVAGGGGQKQGERAAIRGEDSGRRVHRGLARGACQ
ncbi:MAG: hypothetical protein L6435_15765 [Anaerolineae bacterium]|nr:hypothetical protein [Anaerolineae bacterium]